ncbi:MAG TPA: beta-L-arabinofuranosidase domain-containing protein [Acidobacteriaceae bacterium]|nr:beta-L-arabinofuranosidase domain-containing protein [Acidobacteriaceae bacterium]
MHSLSRRQFLAGAAAAAASTALPAGAASASAATKLQEFDYGTVQLTGGPLKQQYDRVHASYLALDNDRLLKVYRERAGLPAPGAPMAGWYGPDGFVPGHSLGQYISGLARIGRTTGDSACHQKVRALVEGYAATMGPHDQVFAAPNAEKVWPCYILDKHFAGLLDAYQLSEVAEARELLPRVLHGALPFIPEHGHDRIGKKDPPYDEPYIMPENLFAAWQLTGDRAFYNRATAYLLDREYFDPLARNQDVLPGRHAYSHAMALSSAGKARIVLGQPKYLDAMKNAWEFLRSRQQYATGGWGPNETFVEPHKGHLYESLRTTEDHFETPCGSYAATKLARYLLCATGDARYGDGLERVVLNALLAVKEPDSDGDYPYYSSYNSAARKRYYPQKWPCCSGTLVQGVSDYVRNIYFRTTDGLAVVLYTPSQVRWSEGAAIVTVTQQTEYPLADSTTLHFDSSAPVTFALKLRVPGWLDQRPTVLVNGQPAVAETSRGFAVIRRRWTTGDTVRLEFPQNSRTESIDDLHPDTVALLRGPLVYVEINPAAGDSLLPRPDTLHPTLGASGLYSAANSGRARVYAPLYWVRNEAYSTYFTKG